MTIYTTGIVLIVFLAFIGLMLTWLTDTSKSIKETTNHVNELNDKKDELKEIKKLIKIKQQELENLVHATDQAKRRTVTNLTVEQEDALNKYTSYGIQIPIDIIEELSYSNNVTYHSAITFIETQRKSWKAQLSVPMTKGMM